MRVYTLYIVVVSVERGVLAVFVTFRIKQQRRFLFASQAKSLPSGATAALLPFLLSASALRPRRQKRALRQSKHKQRQQQQEIPLSFASIGNAQVSRKNSCITFFAFPISSLLF